MTSMLRESIRCLVAIEDPAARDAIAEALKAFEGVEIDALGLEDGRDQLHRRRYDLAFVTLKSSVRESRQLLEEIRDQARDIVLIGVTPAAALTGKRFERSEYSLFALLGTPFDIVDVYATLRRAIDRIRKSRDGRAA